MTSVRSDQLRRYIQNKLTEMSIIWQDGPIGPPSQTGIEYKELIITAGNFDELCKTMTAAILAFSNRDSQKGVINEKCFWRVAPDYDEGYAGSHTAYVRFAIV